MTTFHCSHPFVFWGWEILLKRCRICGPERKKKKLSAGAGNAGVLGGEKKMYTIDRLTSPWTVAFFLVADAFSPILISIRPLLSMWTLHRVYLVNYSLEGANRIIIHVCFRDQSTYKFLIVELCLPYFGFNLIRIFHWLVMFVVAFWQFPQHLKVIRMTQICL